jgi:hypothetical protein
MRLLHYLEGLVMEAMVYIILYLVQILLTLAVVVAAHGSVEELQA